MFRRTPRSTLTDTLCPYTTHVRSVQTAAVGAVGDAARYRESMIADQRRDRTRMGDGRTAAPAGAPPLRPALVAQPGAGDRQRAGVAVRAGARAAAARSEEHTSELQSLMRISYAGLCLKKNNI